MQVLQGDAARAALTRSFSEIPVPQSVLDRIEAHGAGGRRLVFLGDYIDKGSESARVIGILTEKHTLKRYSDELDRQRRASVGDVA